MDFEEIPDGECFNCDAPVDRDYYCFGCRVYVCTECELNINMPFRDHDPNTHLENEDEDF